MTGSWQNVVVGLAAVAAAAWLIRSRMKKKGCDDCALAEAVRKQPVPQRGAAPGAPPRKAGETAKPGGNGKPAARALLPLVAGLAAWAAAGTARADEPRNLLLIVVDTLRQDHVGAYGHPGDPMPAATRLAAGGVQFERAYSTAPWTKSSVASILTGLYPGTHGVKNLDESLPATLSTLAEILGERGYRRGGVVSNVLLGEGGKNGFAQGFERYLESSAGGHDAVSSEEVTRQAMGLLTELGRGDAPFFLFVLYYDPHYNWVEHPELGRAPVGGRGSLRGSPTIGEMTARREQFTEEEMGYLRDLYDGEIAYTDLAIRRLLAALEESGHAGDTIVALTSDHGEEFRERGWIGHTRTLYEELLRVPLVVRGPGVPAGRLVRAPVSLVALPPTLMELMGLDAAGLPFQEPSFAGLLRGDGAAPPLAYGEVDFDPVNPRNEIKRAHKKTIVVGSWKLVRDDPTGTLELYDLSVDPGERDNLADAKPDLRDRLLALLEEREAGARSAAAVAETRELTEEELERLRGLGYVQ